MNNHDASATYYDTVAPGYDAALAKNDANAAVRLAFHQLVRQRVPTQSVIMDFGCGTGTDARDYIRMGYQVVAYDNSTGMMHELEKKCAAELSTGDLIAVGGRYETLVTQLERLPRPMAVVSNFAVLNQIQQVGDWLTTMAQFVAPGGWILVNVLNPFYWWDWGGKWWWQGLRAGWRNGYIEYANTQGFRTFRHFNSTLKQMGREAGLQLRVEQGAGILLPLHRPSREQSLPFRIANTIEQRWGRVWGVRSLGNFVFLGWQKA